MKVLKSFIFFLGICLLATSHSQAASLIPLLNRVSGLEWPAVDPAFQYATPVRVISVVNEPQEKSHTLTSVDFKTSAEAEKSLQDVLGNLEGLVHMAESERVGKFVEAQHIGFDADDQSNKLPILVRFDTYGGYVLNSMERVRSGVLVRYEKNEPKAYFWEVSFTWKYKLNRKTVSYKVSSDNNSRSLFQVEKTDVPTNVYQIAEDLKGQFLSNEDRFLYNQAVELLFALRNSALFVNHPNLSLKDFPDYFRIFIGPPFEQFRSAMLGAFSSAQSSNDKESYSTMALFVTVAAANLYQDAKLGPKEDTTKILLEAKKIWQEIQGFSKTEDLKFTDAEKEKLARFKRAADFFLVWNDVQ